MGLVSALVVEKEIEGASETWIGGGKPGGAGAANVH